MYLGFVIYCEPMKMRKVADKMWKVSGKDVGFRLPGLVYKMYHDVVLVADLRMRPCLLSYRTGQTYMNVFHLR